MLNTTPLMSACECGRVRMVELLLIYHANPECQNKNGFTALMFASANGHLDIVELLLATVKAYPGMVSMQNIIGETALILACKNNHVEIVKLLLATGKACPNMQDYSGNTALMHAKRRSVETSDILMYTHPNYNTGNLIIEENHPDYKNIVEYYKKDKLEIIKLLTGVGF